MKFKLKRTTKMGAYTVVIALVVLAAIVLVNMIVAAIPQKYTVIDTSLNKLYSISEYTEKALRSLDTNVTIYFVCPNGKPDESFMPFLERYSASSSRVTIKILDPVKNPLLLKKYTENWSSIYNSTGELSDYSIIVESDKRFKTIDFYDMFDYYTASFIGERVITSAIDYVTTDDDIPKVYTLSGHNEANFSDFLANQISVFNYALETLKLATMEAVPKDASAVIINVPRYDISAEEAAMLTDYLDNGGNIFLITSAATSKFTNLYSLTEQYGLSIKENIVIESNAGNFVSRKPYCILPDVGNHSITSSFDANTSVRLPFAHPITVTETAGVTATKLFTTSKDAYTIPVSFTNLNFNKTDSSEVGSFALGAIAEHKNGGELLWVGSDSVFLDDYNQESGGANYKFILSSLSYMCPRDTIISDIPTVSLQDPTLTVTAEAASFWKTTLMFVIPFSFLGAGVLKWWLRRRK